MSTTKKIAGLGLGVTAIVLIVIAAFALGGLFWGWLFMIIAGAAGWHVGFGTSFLIGIGITTLVGTIQQGGRR